MRYVIEIDTASSEGNAALKYLKKLKSGKSLAIHKWQKLTPKDIALPGGVKPTDWQWEEYLSRKQGKGKSGEKAFSDIKKKLLTKYGK